MTLYCLYLHLFYAGSEDELGRTRLMPKPCSVLTKLALFFVLTRLALSLVLTRLTLTLMLTRLALTLAGVNILSFQWILYPGTITSFLDVKGRITVRANHQG